MNAFHGPLRRHLTNRRYFTDDSGAAIYLTGSHTWAVLQDMWLEETPRRNMDYVGFLDMLEENGSSWTRGSRSHCAATWATPAAARCAWTWASAFPTGSCAPPPTVWPTPVRSTFASSPPAARKAWTSGKRQGCLRWSGLIRRPRKRSRVGKLRADGARLS